jgi:Zn-dependent protease
MNLLPGGSLKIGRVGPIEININVTWLVILGLLVYSLRTGYLAQAAPGLSSFQAWAISVVGALALFASVLAHELAHSLVALRCGLSIRKITLFIFGGVAQMEGEPRTPGVEFKMAIAGPLTSVAIAAILGFLRFYVLRAVETGAAVLILEYATYANGLLACFNLIPGYPLDGGRLLRAVIWKVSGSYRRATVIAATSGRIIGLGLVFLGSMLSVAWDSFSFLWLVLVGSFLERLAYLSIRRVRPVEGGLRVAEVMHSDFAVLAPSLDLGSAWQHFAGGAKAQAVGENGMALGVLTRAHIAAVPPEQWSSTTVESVMAPYAQTSVASPEENVKAALRRMLDLGVGCMPVVSSKRLVGIVTRGDLIAALRRE